MQIERLFVWLVGLVAVAASAFVAAGRVESITAEPAIAVLAALVAVPLAVVFGRLLLNLGDDRRGWS